MELTLEQKAYIAVWRVKKTHQEIELADYQRVLNHYNPDIPAFDIILSEVERISNNISELDKLIASV
jgi:hypothetical protein